MKRLCFILSLLLFTLNGFAQSDDSLFAVPDFDFPETPINTPQDTIAKATEVQPAEPQQVETPKVAEQPVETSHVETPQSQPTTALPLMLQNQDVRTSAPTVTSIISEIPNDTVKPVVKIKVVTTEELVQKEQKYAELASAPLNEKVTAADTKKHESSASPEDMEVVAGRTYKVQVMALQTYNQARVRDIKSKVGTKVPVIVDEDDGFKKYMVGEFNTYYEAVQYRDELVKKGFKGAFVVVYFRGHRVSRQEKGFEVKKITPQKSSTQKK
ncbi:MAG: SPOR domain-containing protein [Bacteroidales bacterium]|nr:SPOR domain-containing protein [Bacteroidales bacterium]